MCTFTSCKLRALNKCMHVHFSSHNLLVALLFRKLSEQSYNYHIYVCECVSMWMCACEGVVCTCVGVGVYM